MSSDAKFDFFPEATHEAHEDPDKSILLIYTGGTIGAVPSDRNDSSSPLKIAEWLEFESGVREIGVLRKRGVRIDTVSLREPLDSTNVVPAHWTTFVEIIQQYYDQYMGFVILHGTDTMVYTASALSFMLDGLEKPVVITGSQVPILDHPGTDGVNNLVNAIKVAAYRIFGLPLVPELCIAFDRVLLRGNRARKFSAAELAGFTSPNFPPLGKLEAEITIDTNLVLQPRSSFTPRLRLNSNVISLQIFPGIQTSKVLAQLLDSKDLKAVVLQAYGTGNAPTAPEFLEPIRSAIQAGKLIVDVSQCFNGSVKLGQYETGIGLLKLGVLTGSDITPEAALCKLMVLLGRAEMRPQLAKFVQQSRVGEQSESLFSTELAVAEGDGMLDGEGARIELLPQPGSDTAWGEARIVSAWLHLHDTTIVAGRDAVEFEIYFNLDADVAPTTKHRGFAGAIKKRSLATPSFVSFDVLRGVGALTPGQPPNVTIVLKSDAEVTFTGASLLVFADERHGAEVGH